MTGGLQQLYRALHYDLQWPSTSAAVSRCPKSPYSVKGTVWLVDPKANASHWECGSGVIGHAFLEGRYDQRLIKLYPLVRFDLRPQGDPWKLRTVN